jgi:tRNA threonylcarbamoyladenosine biosynthesis protein TsaB
MDGRWLLLETSEVARAGLAVDGQIVATVELPKGREHNRNLVPTVSRLLEQHGCKPADLTGIVVGIGPGSYTGLRIGLMLAKSLAYATGCRLIAVPSFYPLAAQVTDAHEVDVIADALKQTVYVQKFGPADAEGVRRPLDELRAAKVTDWLATLSTGQSVTGPGLELYRGVIPGTVSTTLKESDGILRALWNVARTMPELSRAELFSLEPLYVRGSSAEEKAKELAST